MLRDAKALLSLASIAVALLAPTAVCGQSQQPKRMPLSISKLPITFEPNQGQAAQSVRFLARAVNASLSMRPASLDFRFSANPRTSDDLSIEFVNASADTEISAVDLQSSQSNYILGRDSSLWHTHIPNYSRVNYASLYPGIDLTIYGAGQEFEHDFIVAPGASSGQIRMKLGGARRILLASDGSARVLLADGWLTVRRPNVYQQTGTGRQPRDGRFMILAKNEIGFDIGRYDHRRPLIIDPSLSYSTFLANSIIYFGAFTSDASGSAYISGQSFGGYPVTSGAFQQTCASCAAQLPDAIITKLNAEGTAAVFSTYLGGNNYDQPTGIAVDSHGNVIVAGYTSSPDFPVKNPVPAGSGGNATQWAFITSLSPDGSSLNYSSILGGAASNSSSTTWEFGVALDSDGNAYITGYTDSALFPLTPGALNNINPQYPKDAVYVTKFLANGSLGYSALLGDAAPQNGGGGFIGPTAVAVDTAGSAYITGAAGTLWPTTSGAYQTKIPGAMPYAAPFVTKMAADGSAIVYSTFIGDQGTPSSITVDHSSEAYFTGSGVSSSYPTTSNAFEGPIAASGCCPAFISKLNASGSQLLYSSFLYGSVSNSSFTYSQAVALDSAGDIWLAGYTDDPQFPLARPIQSTIAISSIGPIIFTGFVSELNPAGSDLLLSTFFAGPTTGSQISGIGIDSAGNVHFAGVTGSDLYTTPGAYVPSVTTPPPDIDNFLFGFAASMDPSAASPLICISSPENAGIGFTLVAVGAYLTQTLTLNNCGTSSLNVSSVQASSSLYTVPTNLNGCVNPVAAGASCTLSVTFTPTMAGNFPAQLIIQSNTPIPQTTVPLFGSAVITDVSAEPSTLTFASTLVGQTSPSQSVIVTNTGTTVFSVNVAQTVITPNYAFTQTGCGQPLQPEQNCTFSISFTPTIAGSIAGSLTIATSDVSTPHVVVVFFGTGINPDFSLSSGGTSQSVAAGATATYNLSVVARAGYTGTVTFSCSQVPMNATCTVNPSKISLSSGQTASFAVSVATEVAAADPPNPSRPPAPLGLFIIVFLAATTLYFFRLSRSSWSVRKTPLPLLALAALGIVIAIVGCGGSTGGGSGSNPAQPAQTPAGTYTLQLTATDGTKSHSESLTLTVQ